jgi:Na+/melibiose symporter-like transporter
MLATVIPGGFALLAALVVRVYSLDSGRLAKIQTDLEARRVSRGEA